MINEYTYEIGMSVISWTVAIFMVMGMMQIMIIKAVANDRSKSDVERLMAESFVNQFNGMKFPEKVVKVMYYGALTIRLMFLNILKAFCKKEGGKEK